MQSIPKTDDLEAVMNQWLGYLSDNALVRAGLLVVASVALALLVDLVITRGLKRWARKSTTELDDRLIRLAHRPIFLSVLLLGLYLALGQLPLPSGVMSFFVRLLQTLAILIWTVFVLRSCSIVLEMLSALERRFTAIQPRTVTLFDQILKIAIAGGAVYFLFLVWGVNVGAYLAGAGIVGIAVGFAAKDTLANFFSGIFILADAPYQVGDFIVLDTGERGMVTHIGLRSTRLLTRDDIEVTLPNAVIGNAKITNESGGRWEKQRVRVRVGVAYGSDIDRVSEILLSVARDNPTVDDDPEPRVRFRSFGESGLDFELLGWVHQPVLRGRVLHELNSEVYKRFAAARIEIPYPKRDVYLHPQPPKESK